MEKPPKPHPGPTKQEPLSEIAQASGIDDDDNVRECRVQLASLEVTWDMDKRVLTLRSLAASALVDSAVPLVIPNASHHICDCVVDLLL